MIGCLVDYKCVVAIILIKCFHKYMNEDSLKGSTYQRWNVLVIMRLYLLFVTRNMQKFCGGNQLSSGIILIVYTHIFTTSTTINASPCQDKHLLYAWTHSTLWWKCLHVHVCPGLKWWWRHRSVRHTPTRDQLLCGAEEACWAHNPKVDGSKPSRATLIVSQWISDYYQYHFSGVIIPTNTYRKID